MVDKICAKFVWVFHGVRDLMSSPKLSTNQNVWWNIITIDHERIAAARSWSHFVHRECMTLRRSQLYDVSALTCLVDEHRRFSICRPRAIRFNCCGFGDTSESMRTRLFNSGVCLQPCSFIFSIISLELLIHIKSSAKCMHDSNAKTSSGFQQSNFTTAK